MEEVWEKDGEEQPKSKVRMRIESENIDVLDTYIYIYIYICDLMVSCWLQELLQVFI